MSDWEELVNEHGPALFAIASRILGDAGAAEDVVQEVFLEAFQMKQRRELSQWSGLLHRMATCRSLDWLRKRKLAVSIDSLALASRIDDPLANAVSRELAERLREAISDLPPHEGEVFCLRYFEELSYQQIAEVLNSTSGAVATALHRARAKLEIVFTEIEKGTEL